MGEDARRTTTRGAWLAPWALAASLLLVGSFLAVHASWCRQAIQTFNELGSTSVFGAFGRRVPAPLNRSAFLDGDSYAWVDYASSIARGESFRVRRNDRDNHPFGREVHWSNGYAYLLAAAGWARKLVAGGDIGKNVEIAAVVVNPLLYFLLLGSAAALTARSFGCTPASLLVLAAGGAHAIHFSFFPGRPDHHGLITAAAWGTAFCLFAGGAGWARPEAQGEGEAGAPGSAGARRWFLASAAMGGVGFWVSALSQSLVTAIICASVVIGSFLVTPAGAGHGIRYRPELWRLWGRVGAAVCLVFYLLEYFPDHLAWRLEVNHPLYALAWWGCGELLACFLAWRAGTPLPRGRDLVAPVFAVAAVSAVPLLVLLGGSRFYLPLDPLWVRMLRMVVEQLPAIPSALLRDVGLLAAAALLSALLLAIRRPARAAMFSIALAGAFCLLTFGLALAMRRWVGLFEAALVLLITVCAIHSSPRPSPGARPRTAALLLVAALLLFQFGLTAYRQLGTAAELRSARTNELNLLEFSWLRTVAEAIRADAPSRRVVVLSDPGTGEVLSYFGSFGGIASQYWENLEGLRAAADIYTARSDDEALALIRQRGITHIVQIRSYEPSRRFFELKYGRFDPDEAFNTFGSKLHVRMLPAWLRKVPLYATAPQFRGLDADVFAIDPARLPGFSPAP